MAIPEQIQKEFDELMAQAQQGNADTQPAPAPGETPVPATEKKDWKAAYLTLQGKYNAEVPRLNTQLQQQAGEVSQLREQLQQLQSYLQQQQIGAQQQQYEQFKSDQLLLDQNQANTLDRMIDNRAQQVVAPLQQQMTQSMANLFQAAINQDYGAVKDTPEFAAFLASDTPIGGTYQQHLDSAMQNLDAAMVNRIISQYAKQAAKAPEQNQTLLSQVVPPRAQSTVDPTPKAAPALADMKPVLDRVNELQRAGKAAEAQALYQQAAAALKQGGVSI